ncbi:hypothetical protein LTR78_002657 [Recurvomyces mirabilis]|uniref:Glycoside hydrolase family 5 domain-containing protein n=1 Tax=Recurvomyces mirabilis TaxID=574656 RepID=A0AAE0WTV4_9PEZI|nr:hypothetical protein LTR78_002657 [Recurvomyces mirabilis]KAK5157586.1 hypothetical protein LTS14_004351 [Recurvomyces mirabilis]
MYKTGIAGAVLACASAAVADGVVRGVNLGGWLVTEPWMTPSVFEKTNTTSEWALCSALGKDEALSQLQNHWSTFYTRDDLVAIKKAGLTAIRIPLGYWAVDLLDFEPYVSGQYPYLVQAIQWANELGLKAMIDLHGVPGSQNGWEESGIVGGIEFPANSSNSDRSLKVLQNLTTEFTKSQYGGVVTNIELMNEPIFANAPLQEFYTAGAKVVGPANSSGINTTIHDAFYNPPTWKNYDPYNSQAQSPAPYVTLDTHQFWAFPPLDTLGKEAILERICQFGQTIKTNNSGIPPTLVGEFSLSTGYTANSTSQTEEDQDKRTWFRMAFEAQNAAYAPNAPGQASIGWYFWAWKTEYDIDAWSYRRGLADGYIPSNVSDPTTYVFPIMENGCINENVTYSAPKNIPYFNGDSNAQSASSSASASSTGKNGQASATSSGSAASATKSSSAGSVMPALGAAIGLAAGAVAMLS